MRFAQGFTILSFRLLSVLTFSAVHVCTVVMALVGHGTVALVGHGTVALVGRGTVALVGHGTVALVGRGTVALVGRGTVALVGHGVLHILVCTQSTTPRTVLYFLKERAVLGEIRSHGTLQSRRGLYQLSYTPCTVCLSRYPDKEWVPVVRRDQDVWNPLDQTLLLHQERHASLCRGQLLLVHFDICTILTFFTHCNNII